MLRVFKCLIFSLGGQDPQTPSSAGVEADLDVEVAFGLTFPIPVSLVIFARVSH